MTYADKYQDCLNYIDKYWERIIYKTAKISLRNNPTPVGNPNFIQVPYTYFVPNDRKFKHIFYWDSFFMFRGIMGTDKQYLMKSMVNNFIYLFKKYKIVPNFNSPAALNRSQPPFLSSMILDAYFSFNNSKIYIAKNKFWLKKAMDTAKKEYDTVWIDKESLYNHHVEGFGLSRYGDRDIGYAHTSELESGWDMTSRFYNHCDQFLPIDLNCYLYKYELDFTKAANILGNKIHEEYWHKKTIDRKKEINKYMWNDQIGFFYDYGYVFKQSSNFLSLASYTPLWAGLATHAQAKRMVEKLSKFETPYGLTITAKESLAKPIDISKIQRRYHPAINDIVKPKQWDYPNIWSPLEYLTVIGLLKYGFITDAKRIMHNSVTANANVFRTHGTLFEKLDGTTGGSGKDALYDDQQGFGWTNAVMYRYIKILDLLDQFESIYKYPKPHTPPYELSILH